MSQIIDLIEQLNEKEYEYYLKHEEYFDYLDEKYGDEIDLPLVVKTAYEKGLVDPSKN